ncbi:anthranilate synthase, component II [Nocardioides scoriae]|uniref:Anthranilate synthase, component II n=1 Tax=Nocardioides scoriae TaxID=642780 RepID=A0A1H1W9Z2_9ACTN|nr:aminodeoxychorismate/anthranilate synthase component II [Nocardioides scoriae]SDS94037.1 anthranilate synthase, component II [Nocardioides scoriae]
MAAPDVLVVDHYDSYTWNLVHLVAAVTGVLPTVVEHDAPGTLERAAAADHVVLSPGPGHPADAHDFALGRDVFALGRPVLGVCLGMQALVTAHGGTVARVEPAHGELAVVHHDGTGLFAGVPDPFEAVRYHSLAAVDLGPVLVRTAHDGPSGVVMAVAHPDLPLVGVQFHPESVLSTHGEQLVRNFLAG